MSVIVVFMSFILSYCSILYFLCEGKNDLLYIFIHYSELLHNNGYFGTHER
jgi:hypothetical protein